MMTEIVAKKRDYKFGSVDADSQLTAPTNFDYHGYLIERDPTTDLENDLSDYENQFSERIINFSEILENDYDDIAKIVCPCPQREIGEFFSYRTSENQPEIKWREIQLFSAEVTQDAITILADSMSVYSKVILTFGFLKSDEAKKIRNDEGKIDIVSVNKWLTENREDYQGKWVAFRSDQFITSAETLKELTATLDTEYTSNEQEKKKTLIQQVF